MLPDSKILFYTRRDVYVFSGLKFKVLEFISNAKSSFLLIHTGKLDDATLELLSRPRCGVPDVFEFRITFSMWHKHDLTYCINATYRNLSQDTVRSVIKDAWNVSNTFVSKALWYTTFKKLDCSLIWNFYRMYHSIHSSNCANFMKK